MADYRTMFDRDYIGAWDLGGKDRAVTISKVIAGDITGTGGKKTKKPVIFFDGSTSGKGLACCKTNCKIIASLYGTDTTAWIGKRITLYPTTTSFGSETVDCIRVRPQIPSAAPAAEQAAPESGAA